MGNKGSPTNNCALPPGSRVADHLRDSGGDEQERSVDQQRRVAEEYCRQHLSWLPNSSTKFQWLKSPK